MTSVALPAPADGVAFLFTDIEGSTTLLHELGDSYSTLLSSHREIVRAAVNAHEGVELGTQGDSFVVAFADPASAINAALAALAGLARCTDDFGRPVKVRMGVHAGRDLIVVGSDYVGMTIHLAARIGSAANGGQLVVSRVAWEGARYRLDGSCQAVDLGLHRLKDIPEMVQLFRLTRPDIETDDRPVRTVPMNRSNVEPAGPPLMGRDDVLEEVETALRQGTVVTLTGPGGVGKSSVARKSAIGELEGRQRDVWWVALGSARDGDGILAALTEVLDLPPSTDPSALVRERLAAGRALLVLDGCEHLTGYLRPLLGLLDPSVSVLATSREPLGVSGERVLRLAGLGVDDAARLLWERSSQGAAGREPDASEDKDCREIAERLDGIPLALELAAARTWLLALPDLLARLDDSLGVLRRRGGGVQDTLRGTIAWSFELLDAAERRVMSELSVFAGSFEALAAESVCSVSGEELLDLLEALVAKSLIVAAPAATGPRLRLLDPVRQFAAERLNDDPDARGSAVSSLIEWAEEFSAHAESGLEGADTLAWLQRTRTELPNVVAAAAAALASTASAPEAALRIATRLRKFWLVSGLRSEGYRLLTSSLAAMEAQAAPPERLLVSLLAASEIAFELGDAAAAIGHAERALQLAGQVGDRDAELRAVGELGYHYLAQDDLVAAQRCLQRLKAAQHDGRNPRPLPAGLLSAFGETAAARRVDEEALSLSRRGQDAHGGAVALNFLASLDVVEGDLTRARERFLEALVIVRGLGDESCTAVALHGLASVNSVEGDLSAAISLQQEALMLRLGLGEVTSIVLSAEGLADILFKLGEDELATRIATLGSALADGHGGRAYWPHTRAERDRVRELALKHGPFTHSDVADPLHELRKLAQSLGVAMPGG